MVRLSGLRIDRITIATALAAMLLAGPALAREVGVTSAANPSVTGSPPGAASRTLYVGTDVFFNERVQTSARGQAQILLLDGSAFTVGPNSDLVIDEFVYNDRKSAGQLVATMVEGVMRFVGGSLSKQPGGVTIMTPVATIGIRGAIATLEVEPGSGTTTVALIYGDEITITGNDGKTARLTSAGYRITVTSGGAIGEPTPVSEADIAAMLDVLSGEIGSDGGAGTPPTDSYVSTTEIVQLGSASDPVEGSDPPIALVSSDGDATTDLPDDSDTVRDGVEPVLEPVAEPTEMGRYLAAGDSYTVSWDPDNPIKNPGSVGLLGGGEDTDQAITGVEVDGDRLLVSLSSGDVVDLPYRTGDFSFKDAKTPAGGAWGTGFVSEAGDFFYYELTLIDDPDGHILLFGGEPLDPDLAVADGMLRQYGLADDGIQGLSMPFISTGLLAESRSAYSSGLYVLEPDSGTVGTYPDGQATPLLNASLMIEGQGIGQRSAVVVTAGDVRLNEDTGTLQFNSARRGSVRRSAEDLLVTLDGRVSTIPDADGNAVFGADGEYFLLGLDPGTQDAFGDSYAGGAPEGADIWTGTRHLALLRSTEDGGLLSRGDRILNVYSAGITESPDTVGFFWNKDNNPENSTLTLSASTNQVGMQLLLESTNHDPTIAYYRLGFGWSADVSGDSAYIDDDRYGALNNTITTGVTGWFAGEKGDELGERAVLGDPTTYFFANSLVPVAGFLPKGTFFCTCAFMEWGYWGGALTYEYPEVKEGERTDYFHLETWVAGELPDSADIPFDGVASYYGHAIGDVYRTVSLEETYRYIAAGDFAMKWDFASRAGDTTISNFDGYTFSNKWGPISSSNGRDFGGLIGAGEGGPNGRLDGSFFANEANPVAGVGGTFVVNGGGIAVVGTFMGEGEYVPPK